MLAGLLLGFAFLTKMLQAFLVLPGFALAYLWAGPAQAAAPDVADVLMGWRHHRRGRLVGRDRRS